MSVTKLTSRPAVLLIDDDATFQTDVASCLEDKFEVVTASSGSEGLDLLGSRRFDALLLDLHLGSSPDGFETLKQTKQEFPFLPVIVVSQDRTPESQHRATYLGATRYLSKNSPLLLFGGEIEAAIRNALIEQRDTFVRKLYSEEHPVEIVGKSHVSEWLRKEVTRLGEVDLPVLITGETGVGKDLCARAIHDSSSRRDRNFVTVDCPSIPETLAESELFGRAKGAFTGATESIGRYGEGDRGTLFLNEIGILSLPIQAKLLSFLDTGKITRIGSSRSVPVDTRVIAATNENIPEAVAAGRFRKDLFERLNVCPLRIPPLRERREDILELSEHFLKAGGAGFRSSASSISREAIELLSAYDWPGNIRQLRSFILEALTRVSGPELLPEDLLVARPELKTAMFADGHGPALLQEYETALQRIEKEFVEKALARSSGNASQAARELGYSRQHFMRLMNKHGIKGHSG